MKGVSECAVLTIAFAALAQPVLPRTHLNCSTRKVVLISAPTGDTSSAREENLGFWVDDEAKTLTFLDNTPLTVTRLDQFWISADRDGIFYEFDRRDGTLSYASSTTKGGVSTTIVGSGGVRLRLLRCGENASSGEYDSFSPNELGKNDP
jgi:hypothetical protein